jgi:CRISPR-associated protein Csx10
MTSLNVRLTSEQTLAVGTRREVAFVQHGEDHITGSALRGALAKVWIAQHGEPQAMLKSSDDREFFECLFEGKLQFSPALPVGFQREPISVAYCKYKVTNNCAAWFVDLAFLESPTGNAIACQVCGKKDEVFGEHCCKCGGAVARGKGKLHSVPRSLRTQRTRTAVDSRTNSALQSALFSRELLAEGGVFQGTIRGFENLPSPLKEQIEEWLKGISTVRIGGASSVMGRAGIKIWDVDGSQQPSPGKIRKDGLRVLRFNSPAILLDDAGRPTANIQDEVSRQPELGKTTVVNQWVRMVAVGGWSVSSGLPKPMEQAVAAGSTYLIAIDASDPRYSEQFEAWVATGIGHRRREGFGFAVLDPDDWQEPPIISASTAETRKPGVSPSESAHKMAEVYAAVEALRKCLTEDRLPGEEPVNRLFDVLRKIADANVALFPINDPGSERDVACQQLTDLAYWKNRSPVAFTKLLTLLNTLRQVASDDDKEYLKNQKIARAAQGARSWLERTLDQSDNGTTGDTK